MGDTKGQDASLLRVTFISNKVSCAWKRKERCGPQCWYEIDADLGGFKKDVAGSYERG